MDSESNKQIVLSAYAAAGSGDADGYFSRMADDVTLTFFGSHRLARTFVGKEDIKQNFGPVVREVLEGGITLKVTNAVAEGDYVVVEAEGKARTRDGRDYNNSYCIVLRLRDGEISEIREYMDTELTKRVFG
jgi:ketosteroid isomerase-like protein